MHQNENRMGKTRNRPLSFSDGTINDTPKDRGTFNVYSGDWWFGKYVVHGIFDVVPYMLWGNEEADSTLIWDRLGMMFQ